MRRFFIILSLGFALSISARADGPLTPATPVSTLSNAGTTMGNAAFGSVNRVPVVNAVPRTVVQLQGTREGSAVTRLVALPFNLAFKAVSLPFSLLKH